MKDNIFFDYLVGDYTTEEFARAVKLEDETKYELIKGKFYGTILMK